MVMSTAALDADSAWQHVHSAQGSFNYKDPRPFIKEKNPNIQQGQSVLLKNAHSAQRGLQRGACMRRKSNGAIVFGDLDDPNSEVRKPPERKLHHKTQA